VPRIEDFVCTTTGAAGLGCSQARNPTTDTTTGQGLSLFASTDDIVKLYWIRSGRNMPNSVTLPETTSKRRSSAL
jgi:hypothetical protein